MIRPHLALAALLVGVCPLPATAQMSWQEDLAYELEQLEGCEVQFLSQVVERTVNGRQVVMAKAHCRDGRVFDASRSDQLEPFEVRECEASKGAQAC